VKRDLAMADGVLARSPPVAGRRAHELITWLVVNLAFLAIAAVAYCAHEHFKLVGESPRALASLIIAAAFGLAPVRALLRVLLAIEGRVLHVVHGVGGLALIVLTSAGVLSGGPLLTHAATSPFAIMGAAQALMHQDHPRNREQAAALRRFAASLPEIREFTTSRDLTSPANAHRAVVVLTDLLAKAQALGETELRADPGFQSALHQATARFGLTLGLDAADQAIGKLAASPAAAPAVPDLRRRLAAARRAVAN
jgi:hypothetical protein